MSEPTPELMAVPFYSYGAVNVYKPGFELPAVGATVRLYPLDMSAPANTYDPSGTPKTLTTSKDGIVADFRADIGKGWLVVDGWDGPPLVVRAVDIAVTQDEAAEIGLAAATEAINQAVGEFVGVNEYEQVASDAAAVALASDPTIRDAAIAAMATEGDAAVNTLVSNPASATGTTLRTVFAGATRTGNGAVGRNEVVFNVKDYGAVGNNVTDDTAAFQAAIAALEAAPDSEGLSKVLLIPGAAQTSAYVINGQLDINTRMTIRGGGGMPVVRFTQGAASELYGFSAYNPNGIGGSPQDLTVIEGIRIYGNAKALVRFEGIGLFRIRNVTVQNSQSCAFHFRLCQDAKIQDVDVLIGGLDGAYGNTNPDGSVVVLRECNNIYFDMFRAERPRTTVTYMENCKHIWFTQGKYDHNAPPYMTTDPSSVVLNSNVYYRDFGFRGGDVAYTVVQGTGKVRFQRCQYGAANRDSLVVVEEPTFEHNRPGHLTGQSDAPEVEFKDCEALAEASNEGRACKSLVYVAPADPDYRPLGEVLPMQLTQRHFNEGYLRGVIARDENGEWINSVSVNQYAGAWLTDMQTGDRARIVQNSTGGLLWLHEPEPTSRFPNGLARYKISHRRTDNGVRIRVDNVRVWYRSRPDSSVFATTFVAGRPTVTDSFYAPHATTVTLAAPGQATWAGMYLLNLTTGKHYRIRTVAPDGLSLTVDYDRAGEITSADKYEVRAGVADGDITWDDE